MLAAPLGDIAFDEVHLLAAGVQPRPAESEVGPVTSLGKTQDVGVEGDASLDVVDVDRHMMDGEWLHNASLRT